MIETMTPSLLRQVLSWAADEGWNPGLDDADAFLAADPDGFLVRMVAGRPVAAVSVVNHAPDFAFLGLYLCDPQFRGQGHGLAVWQAGLAHAGNRTVGLDGVPAQQANYEKSGFRGAGGTTRFTGTLEPLAAEAVQPPGPGDAEQLIASEQRITGTDRRKFLTGWFADTPARRTLVLRDAAGLRGYGTVRTCLDGVKIGPFHARSETDATVLLGALAAALGEGPATLDVPDSAAGLGGFLDRMGFTRSFQTARMYLGPKPAATPSDWHAVATLELG